MKKMTLMELTSETNTLIKAIECNFGKVLLQDLLITEKSAINIVQLVACIEEVLTRINYRKNGKRVPQKELLTAIKRLDISDKFIHSFQKLKILRNQIVHQTCFVEPISRYFSRDLRGLNQLCKLIQRLKTISNVINEEVYYLTT